MISIDLNLNINNGFRTKFRLIVLGKMFLFEILNRVIKSIDSLSHQTNITCDGRDVTLIPLLLMFVLKTIRLETLKTQALL